VFIVRVVASSQVQSEMTHSKLGSPTKGTDLAQAAAMASQARAQLTYSRRIRHGGVDRNRFRMKIPRENDQVAPEIQVASQHIRMASGAKFSQRMHQTMKIIH